MNRRTDETLYDITIIGGGPTGMFAAYYGGMRKASVKIIESLPQLGGQLAALYPEKFIYDVAGFPKVRAIELVNRLKEQLDRFSPTLCLDEMVIKIEKEEERRFMITTNKGVHYSKSVIITAGSGAFEPRKLTLEEAEKFEKSNLHYFVTNMEEFKDKRVLISGGGDSAVDWANMLEPIAAKVMLVHRRDKFRAHEHSVEVLEASSVEVKTPYHITALRGEDSITQVVLTNTKTEEEELVDVDSVIVNYGFISSLGPIQEWGLEIEKGSVVVNSKMETTIPGIYAAGDICTYPGKVKLIAVGLGEAPTAINNAMSYVDPDAKVQPLHSSSMNL
ncbi:NAD(P)/FAD-dependent oxidoreductase [Rubeoparvulum massiliense]|uniref:NAD(P)/FAD-dependent oxidoreductase n=1 Tax=Rubeoparvulum massiliense TaxID=1631346 RepID=UPI00065DCE44|nr:NAD(P)/FAD-dependent oxidoreductase [Rubeoparvulum massiliense]